MMLLSACGAYSEGAPAVTSGTSSVSEETQAASEEPLSEQPETEPKAETEASGGFVPSVHEDYSDGRTLAFSHGPVQLEVIDDSAASDGKALKISGRTDAWNGADFNCEPFRGNDIKVSGSFRSENDSVKISVQLTVHGNTTYSNIASADTSADSYTRCEAEYTIPPNADEIIVYVESSELGDIYVDDFSVEVSGDYTFYGKTTGQYFEDTSGYPSLKEEYEDYFRIGTCISGAMIEKPEYSELIKAQFSSVTCENDMKPDSIFDRTETLSDKDKYYESPAINFDRCRAELDFAKENGLTVRGHTLLWHNQTPDWIFYKDYGNSGELADRELMLKRLENYIKGVMEWTNENYPGLISAWDVVNEAIDDGGGIRKSKWYDTIGEDYIERAFEFARRYAPEGTKLFYNDYNCYMPGKQNDIIKALTPIKEAGNIDGIGMQSHLSADSSVTLYSIAMKKYYDSLGLEIQVTELDIGTKNTEDGEAKQAEFLRAYMEKLLEFKKEGIPITSVTFWGFTDTLSWRTGEYPLIFRDDLSRKPAFDAMIEIVENQKTSP